MGSRGQSSSSSIKRISYESSEAEIRNFFTKELKKADRPGAIRMTSDNPQTRAKVIRAYNLALGDVFGAEGHAKVGNTDGRVIGVGGTKNATFSVGIYTVRHSISENATQKEIDGAAAGVYAAYKRGILGRNR